MRHQVPLTAGTGSARHRARTLGLTLLALLLPACGQAASAPPAVGPLRVVATHSILADMVSQVGGDRLTLTVLVGPNGDAHTYEPTPADARALARAGLLIENGLGFEPWLDKLYQASGSRAVREVAGVGVTPRTLSENGHVETDPHCWQNPRYAILMTRNIAAALVQADPAGTGFYRDRAAAYIAQLQELDDYIARQVATLPPQRRVLVTSHDALGYFADRYGFKVIGSALASVTTEAADPSARQMAAVIQEVRAAGVPAVFTENMENPKLLQQIAVEAHVRVDTSLYTDALGAAGSAGASYLGMMRHNIDTIVGALRP